MKGKGVGVWELPEGWRLTPLEYVVLATERRNPTKAPFEPFLYVDISSVDSSIGAITNPKQLLGAGAPSRARKVIRSGDVVFATTRPYLRNTASVPDRYDGQICSTGFCVLQANHELVEPSWIFHLCRSEIVLDQVLSKMRGASYPAVTDRDVLACKIPLPPLDEQRRIVARIEERLARIAEARRLRVAADQDADRLMNSVREEVFHELKETAPNRPQLKEIAESRLGKMLSKESKKGVRPRPYLRNANVQWDHIDLSDLYEMDFDESEEEKYRLQPGDLLVCEGGEIGRAAVWNGELKECYFQKALHRVRLCDKKAPPRYLMHFVAWASTSGAIAELRTGSAIPHLTGVRLKTLEVIWPTTSEQHGIVAYLDSVQAHVVELQRLQAQSATELERLEGAILARAFRGEL